MKKILKRIGWAVLIILIIANVLIVITGNTHIYKAIACTYLVGETGPTINDYPKFPKNIVKAANHPIAWNLSKNYNQRNPDAATMQEIEKYDPVAFLVIHNDSIAYEHYWGNYSDTSHSNSFSMAKTLVGLAVTVAIKEGKIGSINDKVIKYLPKLKGPYAKDVTIKNLMQMTSGINFDESYTNPFGYMAKVYYGNHIKKRTMKFQATAKPGRVWKYSGGNPMMLSFILEKVTGESLSQYFSQKIWQPVGAKNDAYWSTDKQGRERSYCCFYSNARDFARIGQLLIDNGQVNGNQIIPAWFFSDGLKSVTAKDKQGDEVNYYGYQTWLANYKGHKVFYLRGIQGQYVICIPDENLVIVRLGNKRSKKYIRHQPADVFTDIKAAYEVIVKNKPQQRWVFDKADSSKLLFKNGKSFETNLYNLNYIGQIEVKNKAPFFILSGRGCTECDANIAIYFHSPANGKMDVENGQNRYLYPGTMKDGATGNTLITSRAFYGQISDDKKGIIWYVKRNLDSGKVENYVFMSYIQNGIKKDTTIENAGNIQTTLDFVKQGKCTEIKGKQYFSEP